MSKTIDEVREEVAKANKEINAIFQKLMTENPSVVIEVNIIDLNCDYAIGGPDVKIVISATISL